jgi:hypothetical protein
MRKIRYQEPGIGIADGALRRAGEGRVPGSHDRRGVESAGPAVAGIGYPAATASAVGVTRQPALSIPVRYPITPSYS